MTKYLSGRVKVKPTSGLSTDRYNYLSLDQAEPNLGAPVSPLPTVPSGTQYQIIGVDGHPGKRYWIPIPVSYTHLRAHETDSYLVWRGVG